MQTEDVVITDRSELAAWLAGQHGNWARLIAARTALRVLPLVVPVLEKPRGKEICLRALSAAFHAWASVTYLTEPNLRSKNASRRGLADAAGTASDSASLAVYAAGAASATVADDHPPSRASETVWAAIDAADSAGLPYRELWAAISDDASQFARGLAPTDVIRAPLWPLPPSKAKRKTPSFPRGLAMPETWKFWEIWYGSLNDDDTDGLETGPFDRETLVSIASQPDDFWKREPDVVNADIARRVGLPVVTPPTPTPSPLPSPPPSEEETPPPPAAMREKVEAQSDEPTADDRLNRKSFALAIVERLDRLHMKGGHDGFAAHIHAPWGAGKTSILKMMRAQMIESDRKAADGKIVAPWVVVDFNAWQHAHRNPPWWPLVEDVKKASIAALRESGKQPTSSNPEGAFLDVLRGRLIEFCEPFYGLFIPGTLALSDERRANHLEMCWRRWEFKTSLLPFVLAILVTFGSLGLALIKGDKESATPLLVTAIFGAVSAYATSSAVSRVALFGSADTAKYYESLSSDPVKQIKRLFKEFAEKTGRPICVFIDDLDRCRSDYVVDLLEGIQTSFRHRNVFYVVAADRNWIKASFEDRYAKFLSTVGSQGQPLGHLFLEKIFQVSTPVPGMSDAIKRDYWKQLLTGDPSPDLAKGKAEPPTPSGGDVERKRVEVRRNVDGPLTRKKVDQLLATDDTPVNRAALALELNASPKADEEARHLLEQFSDIVPDNPRVMKRMINAFGSRQTIGILDGDAASPSRIARWTVLEQRFPVCADVLTDRPDWLSYLSSAPTDDVTPTIPDRMLPFVDSEAIRAIVGTSQRDGLTVDTVRSMTRGSAS